jgi:hypothetical protein
VSLVLVAILVAIWASILVPLLRRERAAWPGGRRAPLHGGPSAPARGGRAVWRPEPQALDRMAGEPGRRPPLTAIDGGAGDSPPDELHEEPAGRVVLGPVARWGRAAASRQPAPDRRRAVFRRRQVLAVLVVGAAAAAVPALLAGGRWWLPATASGVLLAAYLLALAVLARRRHAAARPARAGGGPAPAGAAGPRLVAVPASPE